jgi:hypothetical protein
MKKASRKVVWDKPANISYASFVDDLTESRQLQARLNANVHEIQATVELLEQNLEKAHLFARPQPQASKTWGTETDHGKSGW